MKRSWRLKRQRMIALWRELVKDNASIDILELDRRLKPISYLRKKLADPGSCEEQDHGKQLNLFE